MTLIILYNNLFMEHIFGVKGRVVGDNYLAGAKTKSQCLSIFDKTFEWRVVDSFTHFCCKSWQEVIIREYSTIERIQRAFKEYCNRCDM